MKNLQINPLTYPCFNLRHSFLFLFYYLNTFLIMQFMPNCCVTYCTNRTSSEAYVTSCRCYIIVWAWKYFKGNNNCAIIRNSFFAKIHFLVVMRWKWSKDNKTLQMKCLYLDKMKYEQSIIFLRNLKQSNMSNNVPLDIVDENQITFLLTIVLHGWSDSLTLHSTAMLTIMTPN